jgi:zinc transporter ZupT
MSLSLNRLSSKNKKKSKGIVFASFLFFGIFFSFSCNQKIQNYLKDAQKENPVLKIFLEPVEVEIEISRLSSISSAEVPNELKDQEIDYRSKEHARWFQLQLANYLEGQNFRITKMKDANLVLKTSIVDMAEIRAKKFIEGLSIGLVFGLIAGEVTGDPQVGLSVLVLEIIEEFVILYILKTYFIVTTIQAEFIDKEGNILRDKEFIAYSNDKFLKKLPEEKRSIRENQVKASLDQNAQDIVEYLKEQSLLQLENN